MPPDSLWDDPQSVRYYEAFSEGHSRYLDANRALAAAALLEPELRVLDVAAGTGRTAEVLLDAQPDLIITCFEPAAAMRAAGQRRVPTVAWTARLPESTTFDRIVSGAAMWQLLPLNENIRRLAALLVPGGALCFNIPSAYLGKTDQPGEGRDPYLTELIAEAAHGHASNAAAESRLPDIAGVDAILVEAGLHPRHRFHRTKLTQAALRDWLKIPAINHAWLGGLPPDARAELLDAAFRKTDSESWRWEGWTIWTAWKPK